LAAQGVLGTYITQGRKSISIDGWGGPRSESAVLPPRAGTGPIRVAIVEDEENLLDVLSMFVRNLGYRVEFLAHNGGEIIQALKRDTVSPQVILMDYRMPVMNGVEASKEILRVRPEIRLVILSADDSVKSQASSLGVSFIQKPFTAEELSRVIEASLAPRSSGL
jgi:CheY-like chemotaxis protein